MEKGDIIYGDKPLMEVDNERFFSKVDSTKSLLAQKPYYLGTWDVENNIITKIDSEEETKLPKPSAKLEGYYFEISEEGVYKNEFYEVNSEIICTKDTENTSKGKYIWKKIPVSEYFVKYDPLIEFYLRDTLELTNRIVERVEHIIKANQGHLGSSCFSNKTLHFENGNSNNDLRNYRNKNDSWGKKFFNQIKLMLGGFQIKPKNLNAYTMGKILETYVYYKQEFYFDDKKINAFFEHAVDIKNKDSKYTKYDVKFRELVTRFLDLISFDLIINVNTVEEYSWIMSVIRDDLVINRCCKSNIYNMQVQFNRLATQIIFRRKDKNDICAMIFAKSINPSGSNSSDNFSPLIDRISNLKG